MSTSVSLSFPDSTYTSGNKPSTTTAKSDFSALETAINTHNAATTGEHGVSGTFVGTSDSQTLTNKILTTPTLTSPVINTGISGTAFLDEDDMASDSATKVASQQSIKAYVLAIASQLNPIGTVREFVVSTNPGTLLGFGTWTAFGTGKVTVCIDSGDTDFDTVEETGGAKTVSVAHTHTFSATTSTQTANQQVGSSNEENSVTDHSHTVSGTTGAMSANATPSIVQPYIVVYRWKRTA